MARQYRDLFPQVHDFENLFFAWKAAARGKRGKVSVAAFEWQLEGHLLNLEYELREGCYGWDDHQPQDLDE